MPVRTTIPYSHGIFFLTFTCHQWLHLIERVNGYDLVYDWFDVLKKHGHYINGYVIMPNHVHALINFIKTSKNINTVIGNGKRFMAYDIIDRLQQNGEEELLERLKQNVEVARKENNKLHEVWKLSFDWKICTSRKFCEQKLNYMHNNPCSKKWHLCNSPVEYLHSSAKYFLTGVQGIYCVTNISAMEDVDFIISGGNQLAQRPRPTLKL